MPIGKFTSRLSAPRLRVDITLRNYCRKSFKLRVRCCCCCVQRRQPAKLCLRPCRSACYCGASLPRAAHSFSWSVLALVLVGPPLCSRRSAVRSRSLSFGLRTSSLPVTALSHSTSATVPPPLAVAARATDVVRTHSSCRNTPRPV